ncbi:MAG: class I SAM-dependent methyltransferase [Xanthobacteraceae bacterium]|nr:class I SAM-dependent methyltransferase [Xanthobacteraceae bacterium]
MEAYVEAAKTYAVRLKSDSWFFAKPFDQAPGHPEFFYNMHNAAGILQAMDLPLHAHILEVGCGPGWLTEILALLGYNVTAFDPSEEFTRIARVRLDGAAVHHACPSLGENVRFLVGTIEELEFPDASFDGVIFYDVLHHVIDEEACMANCSKWLRRNGALGIVEGAWVPGNKEFEEGLLAEMARYGTLENPFTQEYLDDLLRRHGFSARRLVGRAGFVETQLGDLPFNALASQPAAARNDLVAIKSVGSVYSSDPNGNTKVTVKAESIEVGSGFVSMEVDVRNVGDTVLLASNVGSIGATNLALRRGEVGASAMIEAANRVALPRNLGPGEEVRLRATFRVPENASGKWYLDVVCEHVAWLSNKGSDAVEIVV